jgi:hypothetical protein
MGKLNGRATLARHFQCCTFGRSVTSPKNHNLLYGLSLRPNVLGSYLAKTILGKYFGKDWFGRFLLTYRRCSILANGIRWEIGSIGHRVSFPVTLGRVLVLVGIMLFGR